MEGSESRTPLPDFPCRLGRSESTRKWDNLNGWPISAAAGCRLVAHIEDKRNQIISTLLRSSNSGQRFRSVISSVFSNEFFDQLTLELEMADREPLDHWIDAALISGEASFYSRVIVLACGPSSATRKLASAERRVPLAGSRPSALIWPPCVAAS